jgi:hypothetical protein
VLNLLDDRIDHSPIIDHLTITIEATGTRNSSSQGSWVWVDVFDVTP